MKNLTIPTDFNWNDLFSSFKKNKPTKTVKTEPTDAEKAAVIQDAYENAIQPQLDALDTSEDLPGVVVGDPSLGFASTDIYGDQVDAPETVAASMSMPWKFSPLILWAMIITAVSLVFISHHHHARK